MWKIAAFCKFLYTCHRHVSLWNCIGKSVLVVAVASLAFLVLWKKCWWVTTYLLVLNAKGYLLILLTAAVLLVWQMKKLKKKMMSFHIFSCLWYAVTQNHLVLIGFAFIHQVCMLRIIVIHMHLILHFVLTGFFMW